MILILRKICDNLTKFSKKLSRTFVTQNFFPVTKPILSRRFDNVTKNVSTAHNLKAMIDTEEDLFDLLRPQPVIQPSKKKPSTASAIKNQQKLKRATSASARSNSKPLETFPQTFKFFSLLSSCTYSSNNAMPSLIMIPILVKTRMH